MLRTALINRLQQRQGIIAQHSQLVNQRTVEHHVGILLEREYPLVLTAAYRRPARYRVDGTCPTELVVADDTADKTAVRSRDVVVVVKLDGGQGGDVDTELLVLRNRFRHQRIQAVDALKQQHHVVVEPETLAAHHALAHREIVGGQLHLLPVQQLLDMLIVKVEVERIDGLIVIFPVLVDGGLLTVHEVVVERNQAGFHSAGHQLHAQALAERGLPAGRRTGHQYHFHSLSRSDLLRNLADALLLQCLCHHDGLRGKAVAGEFVQLAHGGHADMVEQLMVEGKRVQHLLLLHYLREAAVLLRNTQQHAVVVFHQVETPQIVGGRDKRAVVVVDGVVKFVIMAVEVAKALYQLGLLLQSVVAE